MSIPDTLLRRALRHIAWCHEIIEAQQAQIGTLIAICEANEACEAGDEDRIRGALARLEEWTP